jgi:prepilin-type processing-associated H-X9-DG protein
MKQVQQQDDSEVVTAYTAGADAAPPAYPGQPANVRTDRLPRYRDPRANGWSKLSIGFGAIGFVVPVIASALAVLLAAVAWKRSPHSKATKNLAIIGFALGAIGVVWGVLFILPAYYRSKEISSRIYCASNMRQIGAGLILYAVDNQFALPDTLEPILATQDITPPVFVCPGSADNPAADPPMTPQTSPQAFAAAQAHAMMQPGHCSYVYLGRGLSVDQRAANFANARTVILYERLENHNEGMNVLWGDGHVTFVCAEDAVALLRAIQSGTNGASQ